MKRRPLPLQDVGVRASWDRPITRRSVLGGMLALGVAACGGDSSGSGDVCFSPVEANSAPGVGNDLFALGVASGDPLPDGIVLWTRLLLRDREAPPEVPVTWELASDEGFSRVVRCGVSVATADLGYSVHVDVRGLRPGTTYWYRFHAGAHTSPVGRTRTAPPPESNPERVGFAVASCQAFQSGYFTAYRHLAEEELDFVLFVGDYIYELEASLAARPHGMPPPQTLDEYRAFYALNRSDPDLQRAHAAFPWIVTWDDHEVEDNYAGLEPGAIATLLDPTARERFPARRAAAYQAWWEHMPVRTGPPQNGSLRIYRDFTFGRLLHLAVVDDRQYRSPIPRGEGAGNLPRFFGGGPQLPAAFDENASILGFEQEAWLESVLRSSAARWTVLGQQTVIAEVDRVPDDPDRGFSMDAWDGYVASRNRLMRTARDAVRNLVSVGGDIHSSAVTDLLLDYHAEGSPLVGTELVGPSISAIELLAPGVVEGTLTSPHIHLYDTVRRGYLVCSVTPARLRADFRYVSTTAEPVAGIETGSAWIVEDGVPGARRV